MNWFLLIVGAIGLSIGAFFAARNAKFWIGLVKEVFNNLLPAFLKMLDNRPKTPAEWKEQRELMTIKPGDLTTKQRERLKELKKLNAEYKK